MRYDLTVPFAKHISINKNNITFPFRRFEIAKVFRDGPVRVGRDREFTQCDADVVGIEGQYIEAELLSLYVKTFKELNIDIYIKYNSRNLMTGLTLDSGIKDELVPKITTIIDKKDKTPADEFKNMLLEICDDNNIIDRLIELFNVPLVELKEKYADTNNEKILKGLEEVENLNNYLSKIGIGDICLFDSTLARGQNYYTGNVFEVYDKKQRVRGSIGSGGRYDNMVGDFIGDGKEYPTVGISFGLSSIYEILKDELGDNLYLTDIFVIPMGTEIESLRIANELRNNGYNVEIEMNKRKLKKSLDYANKQGIKYVIIVGSNEIETGTITVKDMTNGNSFKIKIGQLTQIKDCRERFFI